MSTKFGVAFDYVDKSAPYGIKDNPVSEKQPPKWLTSWRFSSEHVALMALYLFLSIDKEDIGSDEFRMIFKAALRVAQIDSEWAK